MCRVAGAEEAFGADKEVRIMFAPKHATAVLEVIFDTIDRVRHCLDDVETTAHKKGTRLVSQRHGLFRR